MDGPSSKSSASPRSYDNSHRTALAEQTKTAILEAAKSLLIEEDGTNFSIAAVAERSGVSTATIYRHFPNRDQLMVGLESHLAQSMGRPKLPETLDDLLDGATAITEFYARSGPTMRRILSRPEFQDMASAGRKSRDELISKILEPLTEHLPEDEAKATRGVVRALYSFDTWDTVTGRLGASNEAATRALAWATRALIGELRRDIARHERTSEHEDEESNEPRAATRRRREP